MPENPDADLTLPSVVASLPGSYQRQDLVLTIVFHPRTALIGKTAAVPRRTPDDPWILGRHGPGFGPDQQSLEDAHVSRRALELAYDGKCLSLQRPDASSRCRIAGSEVLGSIELAQEQLRAGVPLLLGHSVVLLLRFGRCPVDEAGGHPLRGSSAYMGKLREQITQASESDLDVLIRGETGTGKELVAAAIHQGSRRAEKPLVSVNMAAVPTGLAAAALFGSARGAYTGASQAAEGYFFQARGGTLFLDEIGDTPPEIQPQLLRALQQREIQAVGGPVRRVDVRVISATDAPLESEACDFKAALRHRLGACVIQLLPLRQHPEDIGELLLHFLTEHAHEARRGELLPDKQSEEEAIAAWAALFHSFLCHPWPGNVRELANFAGQVIMASERQLTLPLTIRTALAGSDATRGDSPAKPRPRRRIQDIDAAEIDGAMQDSSYEVKRAARQLGVSRQSLYRYIGESPIYRLAGQIPVEELREVLAANNGMPAAAATRLRVSVTGLRARLRSSGLDWHGK